MPSRRALAVVAGAVVLACRPEPAPPRPASVPTDAVWAGGVDGGAWIRCEERTSTEYFCAIYNDFTGDVWTRGRFAIHGSADHRSARVLQYNAFDGETVHLKDGRTLRPVKP